jgi:hypothetical protein
LSGSDDPPDDDLRIGRGQEGLVAPVYPLPHECPKVLTMLRDRDAIHRTTIALAGGVLRRATWKLGARLGRQPPDADPLDRFYIEGFLEEHADAISGRVLEVADNLYTRRFGGDRVTRSDVVHAAPGNPTATVVARFEEEGALPASAFDCIIATQTLQMIYRVGDAVRGLHAALKPGGTVLATVPGIAGTSMYDAERWGDHWRFTAQSAQRLFADVFEPSDVRVQAYGNRLAAVALLHGFSTAELSEPALRYRNVEYDVIIGVAATKR